MAIFSQAENKLLSWFQNCRVFSEHAPDPWRTDRHWKLINHFNTYDAKYYEKNFEVYSLHYTRNEPVGGLALGIFENGWFRTNGL